MQKLMSGFPISPVRMIRVGFPIMGDGKVDGVSQVVEYFLQSVLEVEGG
jgi:hypothetical protein